MPDIDNAKGVKPERIVQMSRRSRDRCPKTCGKKKKRIEFNARHWIMAIILVAVPIVTYSFNISSCITGEIKKMNSKLIKSMTYLNTNNPKVDIDCLYNIRSNGGKAL